ncbi:MAG: lipopolysaccharide heptosyltransferase II [Bacteroidota bacterium]
MKILVRLPNWLGDMVMSTGFLQALRTVYPGAEVDVIVKKGLESLIDFMPGINHHYIFSRDEWKGLTGVYRFGRKIRQEKKYDLFFCLPDSFSSACMAWATGVAERIGFKKELRSLLLTRSFTRPASLHRAEEYISLLQQFSNKNITAQPVVLKAKTTAIANRIIINFNSEAVSRRMPVDKAASVLTALIKQLPGKEIVCIGSMKEKEHIDAILKKINDPAVVVNKSGKTGSLPELIELIASGSAMLTTDSGPAHIGNALGVPVVVLFGAGNEKNTAPYNKEPLTVLRLGQLPCEPCVKNTCIYGLPKCLELLDENKIVQSVQKFVAL